MTEAALCCADLLRIMIWLVPARAENINVNVPPFLNAETTVLQDLNDTGYFQVFFSPSVISLILRPASATGAFSFVQKASLCMP